MDILTHMLSGMAASGAIAGFASPSIKKRALIIGCGALGAVLPDIDTITLWSGFDAVIGSRLGLSESGRNIYFGNHWYSHHNWTHSLAAGALFTLLLAALFAALRGLIPIRAKVQGSWKSRIGYLVAFFSGYTMHLLGDLPTPGYVWQGIKLLWPLSMPVGGTGHLWWWNNYDIFVLFLLANAAIAGLVMASKVIKLKVLKFLPTVVFLLALSASIYQISQRPERFVNRSRTQNEQSSLAVQKKILGQTLYEKMVLFDKKVKLYF